MIAFAGIPADSKPLTLTAVCIIREAHAAAVPKPDSGEEFGELTGRQRGVPVADAHALRGERRASGRQSRWPNGSG